MSDKRQDVIDAAVAWALSKYDWLWEDDHGFMAHFDAQQWLERAVKALLEESVEVDADE